jgi:hypothetical protein
MTHGLNPCRDGGGNSWFPNVLVGLTSTGTVQFLAYAPAVSASPEPQNTLRLGGTKNRLTKLCATLAEADAAAIRLSIERNSGIVVCSWSTRIIKNLRMSSL